MCDFLTRGFQAQLTLNMEATLRKSVCDIMRIFENSLHNHQLELVQKGEEVAHLKVKLQTAELKLRDWEFKLAQGAEKSKTPISETQRQPVPEIDFEVPDDWCAPMADETTTTTKQDDIVCPSIRLRPLIIPLHRIPIIKQEVISHDIDSQPQTAGARRSTRCSTLNEKSERTQDKTILKYGPGSPSKSMRGDIKQLLKDIREENTQKTDSIGLRLRQKRGITKVKVKSRREKREVPATKSTEETVENNDKKYSCSFCEKAFDTEFGLYKHTQWHKRCQGCKRVFPFPSSLGCHQQNCKRLKKLLAKKASSTKPTSQSREQVILKKESSPPSGHHSEPSVQKVGPGEKHPCVYCTKTFLRMTKLRNHMRVHTCEKPFQCSMCPKKFTLKSSLKTHLKTIHRDQMNPSELHRDLAWTVPLEDTETTENLILSSKDAHPAISHNNVQREHSPDKRPAWQTMGVRKSSGYVCSVCQKLLKSRITLKEHYRIHTGERPLKCRDCPATFRSCQQRCVHRKRCHAVTGLSQCGKCMKRFSSKSRLNWHASKCLIEKPFLCKDCGKGFKLQRCLLTHMVGCHT